MTGDSPFSFHTFFNSDSSVSRSLAADRSIPFSNASALASSVNPAFDTNQSLSALVFPVQFVNNGNEVSLFREIRYLNAMLDIGHPVF